MMQVRQDIGVDDYRQALKQVKLPQGERIVMSLAEQLYQQGMEQGMEQGIEQGVEQGKLLARRADILYFLRLRFQEDSVQVKNRLGQIESAEILESLLHSAYSADSYDDFLAIINSLA